MAERNQESTSVESIDDMFDPILGDIEDDEISQLAPISSEKQRLAAKRRRAEQRLEQRRLRDELGYYDLEFDDI
tara:strand:- start:131136 stop:131357 length:222 start_codon:yes stop_codon:yes gene_type:complete